MSYPDEPSSIHSSNKPVPFFILQNADPSNIAAANWHQSTFLVEKNSHACMWAGKQTCNSRLDLLDTRALMPVPLKVKKF